MKDTIGRLEASLREFADALGSLGQSVLGWLKDDVLKTPLGLADGQSTWNVCQATREHIQAVLVVMEVIENADDYCGDSLESAVWEFDPSETPTLWMTEGPAGDGSSVHESLTDLVKVIGMAFGVTSMFLSRECASILESGWSGDSDTRWAQEEVDKQVGLLREKSEMLTQVVSDLIDPRGQQMALLVGRIESHLKELKSRMAIAASK